MWRFGSSSSLSSSSSSSSSSRWRKEVIVVVLLLLLPHLLVSAFSFQSTALLSPTTTFRKQNYINTIKTKKQQYQGQQQINFTKRSSSSSSFPLFISSSSSNNNNDNENNNNMEKNDLPQIPYLTQTVYSDRSNDLMVGEDAGIFDIQNENWGTNQQLGQNNWYTFSVAVVTILTAVAILWIYPSTGYGDDFVYFLETTIAHGNSHIVTLLFGIIFPIVHSGLASLRPYGEQIVGARTWRVIFAFPSLCLAFSWITYFISHAHDGIQFYDISGNDTVHTVAWIMNFVSFFFLYPSVFNLKEVAAVEKPTIHLWETGMIRITRHPQFVGQVIWSAAHLAMVGTSFTALTMALLIGHHGFACWNGDRRLYEEHGENFLQVKERTSIVPFQAILEGRQILPDDYYKELLRGPYLIIAIFTLGAYFAHPFMQGGAALARNAGLSPGGIFS